MGRNGKSTSSADGDWSQDLKLLCFCSTPGATSGYCNACASFEIWKTWMCCYQSRVLLTPQAMGQTLAWSRFLDEDFLIISNNLNVHLCVFCMDNDLSSYQFSSITVWSPFLKILSNIINALPVKRTQLSWASSMSTCLWDSWKKTGIFRLSRAFGATQSSGFFLLSLQQWTCCQHSNHLLLADSCCADHLNQYCTLKW